MSEGPEIHRIAGVLTEEFGGSRIVAIDSRLKKARAWIEEHPGLLEGKEIKRVDAAGKNLIWYLEDDIYFHMSAIGNLNDYVKFQMAEGMPGSIRSRMTRSGADFSRRRRASSPENACSVSYPSL